VPARVAGSRQVVSLGTAAWLMVTFNVVIAVAYLLNGLYFAGRFRAVVLDGRSGQRRRHPWQST
jgi:hypothetical protein